MNLGLSKRSVFVAGSSRGIGLAIARAFLTEGAHVAISGRSEGPLTEALSILRCEFPQSRILACQGDLTTASDTESAIRQTVEAFGTIDIVIANIGSGSAKNGWNLDPSDWNDVLQLNLFGSVHLARAALERFSQKKAGNLIFISSIAGRENLSAPITYGVAKAGIIAAAKAYSHLAGPLGIRVNVVCPGNILFPGGSWDRKLAEKRDFFEEYIRTAVPMQRFGKPEEIADAVVFLASDRASFITGACLCVDGGQTRAFT